MTEYSDRLEGRIKMVNNYSFSIATKGFCDLQNITGKVAGTIVDSTLTQGIVTIFVPGATAGVTTIEFESGAVQDFQEMMERWIPVDITYRHNERWGDGNGFSHVRAAMMSPSLTVPFQDKELLLGTWQQIVVVDFDNRPRQRKVVLQLLGE